MNSENIFGERVKKLRAELNMTQTKLSEVTGIPQPQISKYEKSQEIPYQNNATLLAKGLRTTVDYLFGKTEDPSPNETEGIEKAKEYLNPDKPVIPVYTKEHFVKLRYKESTPVTYDSPIKNIRLTERIIKEKEEQGKDYDDSLIEAVDTPEKNHILQYIINDYDADYAIVMPDRGMESLIPKGAICFVRDTNIKFKGISTNKNSFSFIAAAAVGIAAAGLTSFLPSTAAPFLKASLAGIVSAIQSENLPKQFNIFLPPIFEHDYMWIRKYDRQNNIITPINLLDYPNDTFLFSDELKKSWGKIGIIRGYKMNLDLRDYRKKESE